MRPIAVLALLLILTLASRAAGPGDQYLDIYNEILQGDTLQQNGHPAEATAKYVEAQTALKTLQQSNPAWNTEVVSFRLDYLAEQLQTLQKVAQRTIAPPPPKAVPPAKVVTETDNLREQLRSLAAANAELENKLKEALSVQPAAVSPRELAKAEQKNIVLQKERDLLNVALEQAKAAKPSAVAPAPDPQVEQLRARLAVLEAQAVPLTPEELAVLNKSPSSPPTQLPEAPAERKHTPHSMKDLPPGAGGLMEEANHSMMERDYAAAGEKYRQILRQDENNVYVLAHLARVQFIQGQLAESEKTLTHSLALDPDDPPSLYLMGILRYRQNKFDEALNALSLSAKFYPTNADTQYYLGCVLTAKGMRSAAETAFRKALETDPKYADAHYSLACVYVSETPPSLELARWHYQRSVDQGHEKNQDLEKRLAKSP